jgi:hypothetical protein
MSTRTARTYTPAPRFRQSSPPDDRPNGHERTITLPARYPPVIFEPICSRDFCAKSSARKPSPRAAPAAPLQSKEQMLAELDTAHAGTRSKLQRLREALDRERNK